MNARSSGHARRFCSRTCTYAARIGLRKTPELERFWGRVTKSDGCWEWDRPSPNGYGYFKADDLRAYPAHRFAWIITYGPISDALEVCHDCPGGDNRACVRPDHLFAAVRRINMQDRLHKRGGLRVTEAQVRDIRRRHASGERQVTLRAEFGLSKTHMSAIITRQIWPDLI